MHDDNPEESYSLTKHSWTPTSVEKRQLANQGQPWKQGVWSKEETVQLKQNILEYCDASSNLTSHISNLIHNNSEL